MVRKKAISNYIIAICTVVIMTMFVGAFETNAKTKASLNVSKAWIQTGTTEMLTITGVDNVKWSIASGSGVVRLKSKKSTSVIVKGMKTGTAVISASAGGKSFKCTIHVFKEPALDSLHAADELFIKNNHILYNERGKQICKDVLDVRGSSRQSFWVLKVDKTLYHFISSDDEYSGKKVLKDVEELTVNMEKCDTAYVLKTDGSVWQLRPEEDSKTNKYKKKKYMSGVKKVYCGSNWASENHFVLKIDGSIWGWGENKYGEMANGNTTKVISPRKIISNVKDFFPVKVNWGMAAKGNACYAVKNDGSLYAWGFNHGAIPGESKDIITRPTKILNGKTFSSVRSEGCIYSAIDTQKQLWIWGLYHVSFENFRMYYMKLYPTKVADNVICSCSNDYNVYWITSNNMLRGIYIRGEKDVDKQLKEVQNIMANVKAISNGLYFNYALRKDGTLWDFSLYQKEVEKKKISGDV